MRARGLGEKTECENQDRKTAREGGIVALKAKKPPLTASTGSKSATVKPAASALDKSPDAAT